MQYYHEHSDFNYSAYFQIIMKTENATGPEEKNMIKCSKIDISW